MQIERPSTWTDWYRFARDTLELSPVEAAQYATARFVEQENRARLRHDAATGRRSPCGLTRPPPVRREEPG